MSAIFFNVSGTVLVLNVLFVLIPDGKYAKYVQFVAGLIVILTIAGNFINTSVDYSALNFDEVSFSTFDAEKFENSVREDLIEESIKIKIKEISQKDTEVEVETAANEILKVTILTDEINCGEIIDVVAQYCDINREFVVVK